MLMEIRRLKDGQQALLDLINDQEKQPSETAEILEPCKSMENFQDVEAKLQNKDARKVLVSDII